MYSVYVFKYRIIIAFILPVGHNEYRIFNHQDKNDDFQLQKTRFKYENIKNVQRTFLNVIQEQVHCKKNKK